MKFFDKSEIYSPDIYKTYNLLAIKEGHWDKFASLYGINIKTKKEDYKKGDTVLHYNDNYFIIDFTENNNEHIFLLSKRNFEGQQVILRENIVSAPLSNPILDNGFYVYYFQNIDGIKGGVVENYNKNFRNKFDKSIGSSITNALKISGYFNDGWVTRESIIKIRSGEKGSIKVSGYYPKEITGKETLTVYINEDLSKKITIKEADFSFIIDAPKSEAVVLKIVTNFSFVSPPDIRELSFIIKEIEGM